LKNVKRITRKYTRFNKAVIYITIVRIRPWTTRRSVRPNDVLLRSLAKEYNTFLTPPWICSCIIAAGLIVAVGSPTPSTTSPLTKVTPMMRLICCTRNRGKQCGHGPRNSLTYKRYYQEVVVPPQSSAATEFAVQTQAQEQPRKRGQRPVNGNYHRSEIRNHSYWLASVKIYGVVEVIDKSPQSAQNSRRDNLNNGGKLGVRSQFLTRTLRNIFGLHTKRPV